jgi:hypothetical protein
VASAAASSAAAPSCVVSGKHSGQWRLPSHISCTLCRNACCTNACCGTTYCCISTAAATGSLSGHVSATHSN